MAQINYTIPDDKIQEFIIPFLRAKPIPVDEFGDPIMMQQEWIKECGKRMFINVYKIGLQLLKNDEIVIDRNIIE